MKGKEEVFREIDRLREVSPVKAQSAFAPLLKAVEDFFSSDEELEHLVRECTFQVACDYEYRHTVYQNQEVMPVFSKNFPLGYENLQDLFNGDGVWEEIATINEDVFVEAFQYEDAEGSGNPQSDAGNATAINPYLDDWGARVEAARENIIPGIKRIINFCEGDATNNGLAVYFEEHGGIMSVPTRRETANKVYITGGYLEIIQEYCLKVHIPSYIK